MAREYGSFGGISGTMTMKTERGFTLIEIVVALALFAVTIAYGLSFFLYGMQGANRANVRREALALCNNHIEDRKSKSFSPAMPAVPEVINNAAVGGGPATSFAYKTYRHPAMPAAPWPECRVIETTATWKGFGVVQIVTFAAPQFDPYM